MFAPNRGDASVSRSGGRAGIMAAALVLCAVALAGAAEPLTVTFAARDGVQVTGTLYLPERRPAPGVVLLHMTGRTRRDWEATAARLAEAGIAALAIDFRRGGAAGPAAPGSTDSIEAGAYGDLVLDASAARAYLASRPEVNGARIGMAGASIGASIAVLVASVDPGVQAIALLSPSLEYRGLRIEQALKKFGSRSAMLVASSEDPYALRSARQAVSMGDGPRDLRVLSGAGHGTVMLSRDPDLTSALVDWFVRALL
jgi:dienelactone hydrolase